MVLGSILGNKSLSKLWIHRIGKKKFLVSWSTRLQRETCGDEWRSTSTSVAGVTARVSVCAVAVSGREPLVRRVFLFERVTAKMLDRVRFVLWLVLLNHILN